MARRSRIGFTVRNSSIATRYSRMAANFETLLRDALSHPEKRASELQVQSEAEKQRIEDEKSHAQADTAKETGFGTTQSYSVGREKKRTLRLCLK